MRSIPQRSLVASQTNSTTRCPEARRQRLRRTHQQRKAQGKERAFSRRTSLHYHNLWVTAFCCVTRVQPVAAPHSVRKWPCLSISHWLIGCTMLPHFLSAELSVHHKVYVHWPDFHHVRCVGALLPVSPQRPQQPRFSREPANPVSHNVRAITVRRAT